MTRHGNIHIIATLALAVPGVCVADNAASDTVVNMAEVVVTDTPLPRSLTIDDHGDMHLSAYRLMSDMRVLGGADALWAVRSLPGVSTISDYGSGMSVHGSDYGQTAYSYAGAPVFAPYHFGGLFSAFNTPHLSGVDVTATGCAPDQPDHLGGAVAVEPIDYIPECTRVTADIGMLASTLTVNIPAGLAISARTSYINAIYGGLLQTDDTRMRYGLTDVDLTYNHTVGRGLLSVNALLSADRLRYDDTQYGLDTHMDWGSALASVRWRLDSTVNVTAYYTRSTSQIELLMPQTGVSAPSATQQWGAYAIGRLWGMTLGCRGDVTDYALQSPRFSGTMQSQTSAAPRYTVVSGRLSAGWGHTVHPGGRIALYGAISAGNGYIQPTGHVRYTYVHGRHAMSVTVETTAQQMHQVGLSDIGLASNFWIPTVDGIEPQRSYGCVAVWTARWLDGMLDTYATAYCRRVLHDHEFAGTVIDLMVEGYTPLDHIITSDGYNAGATLRADAVAGPLTVNMTIGGGVSRRRTTRAPSDAVQVRSTDGPSVWHPSAYEPLLTAHVAARWAVTRRLTLQASLVANSGRVYTPVRALYFMGSSLIAEYGPHNSARLPAYHRMDVGATWRLPPLRIGRYDCRHYVNLSLMNVYNHRNVEMQYYKYDPDNHEVYLSRTSSLFRFLPSLSYTVDL